MTISTMITNINRIGLSMNGSSMAMACAGILAMVISQAETMAHATRNMIVLEVFSAASIRPGTLR